MGGFGYIVMNVTKCYICLHTVFSISLLVLAGGCYESVGYRCWIFIISYLILKLMLCFVCFCFTWWKNFYIWTFSIIDFVMSLCFLRSIFIVASFRIKMAYMCICACVHASPYKLKDDVQRLKILCLYIILFHCNSLDFFVFIVHEVVFFH